MAAAKDTRAKLGPRSQGRGSRADSELLEAIVCIGLSDRLEAMQIRDELGAVAALKFIKDTCTITNERYAASRDDESKYEPSQRERAEAMVKARDVEGIISDVAIALSAIHGQAEILRQDTIRDDDDWVLSIAQMISQASDHASDLLDQPRLWKNGGAA